MRAIDSRFFELQSAGYSAAEIASQMGVSSRTVTRWRRQAGLTQELSPLSARPATVDRLEQARQMVEDGCSVTEVCRTLGMSFATVKRHFPGASWTREQVGQHAALHFIYNDLRKAS